MVGRKTSRLWTAVDRAAEDNSHRHRSAEQEVVASCQLDLMLFIAAALSCVWMPLIVPHTSSRLDRSRAPHGLRMIDWPWNSQSQARESEDAKFLRHADLQPGCAPLGIVTAGFESDELEILADTVEQVYSGPDGEISHIPILVLEQSDLRRPLRDVLAGLNERDCELPDQPARPRVPLVMLSGFSTVSTSGVVRALRSLNLCGGVEHKPPIFAVAVPNALDKTLRVLIDELDGDHRANTMV